MWVRGGLKKVCLACLCSSPCSSVLVVSFLRAAEHRGLLCSMCAAAKLCYSETLPLLLLYSLYSFVFLSPPLHQLLLPHFAKNLSACLCPATDSIISFTFLFFFFFFLSLFSYVLTHSLSHSPMSHTPPFSIPAFLSLSLSFTLPPNQSHMLEREAGRSDHGHNCVECRPCGTVLGVSRVRMYKLSLQMLRLLVIGCSHM